MGYRPYQWEAITSLWEYFNTNEGNPIVVAPTASGKSWMIAGFCHSVMQHYPAQRILVLTHVKELIQQNHEKLHILWPEGSIGINSAGLGKRQFDCSVTFCGISSVVNYTKRFGHIDLVLIDEAHRVNMVGKTQYRKLHDKLKAINPYIKFIGFTATPWRTGQGPLEDAGMFTDICFDNSQLDDFNALIYDGYLCPLVPKQTKVQIDVTRVKKQAGDFIQKELQVCVDKDWITEQAVDEIIAEGQDRRSWLIFTTGIDHTEHVARRLNERGYPCGVVHSGNADYEMTNQQRDQTIIDFKSGKLRCIANANILTVGFDHPSLDLIAVIRPSTSSLLHVQMLGRGTRVVYADGYDLETQQGRLDAITAGGKSNCLVLDFAGNTKRLGPINDPVVPGRPGGKGGEAPVKVCPQCDTLNHAGVKWCTFCGHEFIFETKIHVTSGEDDLIKESMPVIETYKIDHITYERAQKAGKPPNMKVCYYTKFRMFNKWVCFEHQKYPGTVARNWWKEHTELPFPISTDEGIELSHNIKVPTHIRVWINRQFPEIMAYDFTGSNFGELAEGEETACEAQKIAPISNQFDEDDIPF